MLGTQRHDSRGARDPEPAREGIAEFSYPDGRTAKLLANPIRLSDAGLPRRAAPALGADTDALLRSLGYDEERIATLRAAGAVG